ncbi:MAG TPA: hypothetical protein VM779_12545 [Thermoanaerobaculia bacterium]|nr:hypothetical protein [Thermoanaerobaculia bacterium]
MKRLLVLPAALLLGCNLTEAPLPQQPLSREPVSVRGWVADVEGANKGELQTPETEGARLQELFQATSIWVEGAEYVSGGLAENGAFILLDVPPGQATIGFNAPGAENATLHLENIPGNADVLIPAILLKPGGATLLQPEGVIVRLAANTAEPRGTDLVATVAGVEVPVIEVPVNALIDRRDYPERGIRPVAIVK